jgi:hypothetical protein
MQDHRLVQPLAFWSFEQTLPHADIRAIVRPLCASQGALQVADQDRPLAPILVVQRVGLQLGLAL